MTISTASKLSKPRSFAKEAEGLSYKHVMDTHISTSNSMTNLFQVDLLEGFEDIQHTRFDLCLVESASRGESCTLRKASLVKSGE